MLDEIENGLKKHNWFKGFDISDEQPMKFTLNKWIQLAKQVQAIISFTLKKHNWFKVFDILGTVATISEVHF